MCIEKHDGVLCKNKKLALVQGTVKTLKTQSTSAEMIVIRSKSDALTTPLGCS